MADIEAVQQSLNKINLGTPRRGRPRKVREQTPSYVLDDSICSPKRKKNISTKTDDLGSMSPTKKNKVNDKLQVENHRPRRQSKYFYYESCSSSNSDFDNLITTDKRPIKTPSKYKQEKSPEIKDIRIPLNKIEDNALNSPIKTNSRRRKTLLESDDEFLINLVPKTPKSKRLINNNTPKSACMTPKNLCMTPKNPIKSIRSGLLTPSIHAREKVVTGDSTPLMRARSQLHVSQVPSALPCRENEYSDVYNFLKGKLLDGCGGCMYISGVPGTGKTATVTCVINALLGEKRIPSFVFVNINGMRLTEPRQSYVEILKQLTGKSVPWEQAQNILDERFTKAKKKSEPIVMLIDELDILCNKRQDVVYNLLDWPSKAKNQLIVITIANTMDLPERLLMSRVTSRLGLTRLTFQPYSHKQLQEIVTTRLIGTNSFNSDAIQFVARKVASVSGDARRALDICRRAAEIAEMEDESNMVSMQHVNEALNAMITQPKVRAIKHCSRLEQLFLQAIVAEVERTGIEETTFIDNYKMLQSVAALDGFKMVSCSNALAAVTRLSACRLILTDSKCNNIYQRIILNVSIDDVFYALKKD